MGKSEESVVITFQYHHFSIPLLNLIFINYNSHKKAICSPINIDTGIEKVTRRLKKLLAFDLKPVLIQRIYLNLLNSESMTK